jgi:hypothetical protein
MYEKMKISKREVINHTSVDDIRVSLTHIEDKGHIPYLKRSLDYEPGYRNRLSVIKMLRAKIKKLEKS